MPNIKDRNFLIDAEGTKWYIVEDYIYEKKFRSGFWPENTKIAVAIDMEDGRCVVIGSGYIFMKNDFMPDTFNKIMTKIIIGRRKPLNGVLECL